LKHIIKIWGIKQLLENMSFFKMKEKWGKQKRVTKERVAAYF
jgi:hypothetical protein